jgi:hypothetical protein
MHADGASGHAGFWHGGASGGEELGVGAPVPEELDEFADEL